MVWLSKNAAPLVGLCLLVAACSKRAAPESHPEVTTSLHAVNASPKIGDFVVLATNSAKVADRAVLSGGDVGVKNTGGGTFLTGGFRIAFFNAARVDAIRTLSADSVELVNGATVGDVQTNNLVNLGGTFARKFAFPAMPAIPALAAVSPGSSNVAVASGHTRVLAPGRFGAVTVGGILRLSGGSAGYDFTSVQVNNDARIEVLGATRVRIAGRLAVLDRGHVVAASATLRAGDIRVEVSGQNGSSGALGDSPKSVAFGNDAELHALLLAPNGTIQIGQRDSIIGSLVGRDVSIDIDTHVNYESGFPAPACVPANCDDSNPCTADVCSNGTCTHAPVAAGTSCSDGNTCNGAETCNASGTCVAGTPPVVDDGNPCTTDTCDPAIGVKHTPVATGTSCSDGNACNGAETCNAGGTCVAGASPVVDDGNPCTTDTCDPGTGAKHTPVAAGTSCSDGDSCNGAETCNATGMCIAGVPPVVDDGNPCTTDTCTPGTGVQHTPVAAGTSCSDGNACNGLEICDGSWTCVVGALPVVNDGNPCTTDTCDPGIGVRHIPVAAGTSCSDGNACNGAETCNASGTCVAGTPPVVNDGNPCTTDTCDPGIGVRHIPVAAGTSCSDGNACNGAETCNASGTCVAGTPPVVDDGNPCTTDTCDPGTGVKHTPVAAGTSCSDGNACNGAEKCNASGTCAAGTPPVVDDGNPCTTDTCDPGTGVKHTPVAAGTSCSDVNACNGAETCNASGTCVAGTPPVVDDGNPCTTDACDPGMGVTHTPVAAGTSCSDGNACNGAETCNANGTCVAGTPPVVDDGNPCTTDTCDPPVGVQHTPVAFSTSCSDGNACNGIETCDANGACVAGTPPVVDDGNPCTTDTCDPVTGVQHTPVTVSTSCSDGNACNGMESCDVNGTCVPGTPSAVDDGNPCTTDICDPAVGVQHTPVPAGTSCSDGSACNGAEVCNDAGQCQPGTSVTCTASDQCHQAGQCDPSSGQCSNPATLDGTSCDDGSKCTQVDSCVAGVCTGAEPKACPPETCRLAWACQPSTGECTSTVKPDAGKCIQAIVIGRVISGITGVVVTGATIETDGEEASVTSRPDGRYTLPTAREDVLLKIRNSNHVSVERKVQVATGVGSVAVDARLVPLAAPVSVAEDGRSITTQLARVGSDGTAIDLNLAVPAGAVAAPTDFYVTALPAQALPALLPLGWSPLAAFDLSIGGQGAAGALPITVSGLSAGALPLVRYDRDGHQWLLVGVADVGADGIFHGEIPGLGAYALVQPDSTDAHVDTSVVPAVPNVGEPIPGTPAVTLPPLSSAFGAAAPKVLPPTGGLVEGRVVFLATVALPSGTIIQVAIDDSFTLSSGKVASSATRTEDLVLFRAPRPTVEGANLDGAVSVLGGVFPVQATRTYAYQKLSQGNIHVDVLGGRFGTRGTIGGADAVTVQDGDALLEVKAGSLVAPTVVSLDRLASVAEYLPRTAEIEPVAGANVDLAGAVLNVGADLTFAGMTIADGESLLLARLERVDGIACPIVVATGTSGAGGVRFSSDAGLPGVTREGTYVVYRSTVGLGFVAGTTTASGGPVQALVTIDGWPLAGLGGVDGSYRLAAKPSSVDLQASLAGTNLLGKGTAVVTTGGTTTLNLALVGQVTVATVDPAKGAIGVAVGTTIAVTTTAPLDPASITTDGIRLLEGPVADNVSVPVRTSLSTSATSLSVIPETRLKAGTSYTLQVSGVRDTFGGVVVLPVTTFTTIVDVPPSYDTSKVDFSMPDSDGMVAVTIPKGTVPPGTTLLITNEGNGVVLSFTVGNDGTLSNSLPASIDDKLVVTITDPLGSKVTFTRSQYVGADGTVAVGPGGGVVKGEGGAELRIPEGALDRGATFKVAAVGVEGFTGRPVLPEGVFASGLRVQGQGVVAFKKEVDLVFPKPADAPDGAFYYIYRQADPSPEQPLAGGAAFEVIDHAFVEGTGTDAKVVTASCPFRGFTDVANLISDIAHLASLPSGGPLNPAGQVLQTGLYLLAYTAEQLAPNIAAPGLIRGRVVREMWDSTTSQPSYVGVPGWIVTGKDASGRPLLTSLNPTAGPGTFAASQADGTFTLWDQVPTRGQVELVASSGLPIQDCPATPGPNDTVRCVTATQDIVVPDVCTANTKYYRNILKANIVLPALQAPATKTPVVGIQVMRVAGDKRIPIDGVAVADQSLILGFVAPSAEVRSVEIVHGTVREPGGTIGRDPLAGQPTGVDYVSEYTPSFPGTYTVTATALPLPSGDAFTVSSTFRVVAAGGDITTPVPDAPPAVLSARTIPAPDADGVPTSVAPQIVFSEPVKGIPGQVALAEADPPNLLIEIGLTGVDTTGAPVSLDGANGANIAVTSLTIQPKRQLKYGTRYKLSLKAGIFDLDNTLPGGPAAGRTLEPYETSFKTVVAQALMDPGAGFSSAGIATVGDYAYLVENDFTYGLLRAFDVSNPADPVESIEAQQRMLGRPWGIAAQADGEGAKVVVATGPSDTSLPSNLRIFRTTPVQTTNAQGQQVTTMQSEWIGAASLTATAAEGIVERVAVKGNFAYTVTTRKGVQVVDLAFAEQLFAAQGGATSNVRVLLNTDGMGFGQEAVVSTIPVDKSSGSPAFLGDLKVADLNDGFLQPIVVAVGDVGIVLVNPQTAEVLPGRPLESRKFFGRAVDVGRVNDRDIAVVVGEQAGDSALVMVDLTNPRNPQVVGETLLTTVLLGRAIDVKLKDGLALVGGDQTSAMVAIVNVENIMQPFWAGSIAGIGGRIAIAGNGAVMTNMPSSSGGETYLGGVRAALASAGPLPIVEPVADVPAYRRTTGAVVELETTAVMRIPVKVFGANMGVTEVALGFEAVDSDGSRAPVAKMVVPLTRTAASLEGTLDLAPGFRVPAGVQIVVTPSVASAMSGSIVAGATRVLHIGSSVTAAAERSSAWADGWEKVKVTAMLRSAGGVSLAGQQVNLNVDSETELVVDPALSCGASCVTADDTGGVTFYVRSSSVGLRQIQIVDKYDNEATVKVNFGRRKVVVLTLGILTKLTCDPEGVCTDGSPPGGSFDALENLLVAKGFDFDGKNSDQVIWYSYTGGDIDSSNGRWIAKSYQPDNTGQDHVDSIKNLYRMIDAFGGKHPNTEFYLVGHSQGGLIALQALGYVSLMPPNTELAGIVTLDAPLGGAPSAHVGFVKYFRGWSGPATEQMVDLWETASDNARQGDTALLQCVRLSACNYPINHPYPITNAVAVEDNPSIKVQTIGNYDDGVYRLAACSVVTWPAVGLDNSSSQVIAPAKAEVWGGNSPQPGVSVLFDLATGRIGSAFSSYAGTVAACVGNSHAHVFQTAVPAVIELTGAQYQ